MRKKTKMANICRSLQPKIFFSPVLKSPTHIGFTDVKKNGSKISHLGTFNDFLSLKTDVNVPTKKNKENKLKFLFFKFFLLSRAGSGSGVGSVNQVYGSKDPDLHPDPYLNVRDPIHC